jgi:MFS family permease
MQKGRFESLSKFPRVFWVVQTFEVMERGAYYSMIPIIAVHAIWNVGVPIWLGVMITVFMYPFQYGLPVLTGALAERVGYKRQIILAFIILTVAYVLLSLAFNTVTMILAVITVGIGIGTYKPLISATVAKCTSSEDRNLAYAIYYWFVNLAAFVIPLIFVIVIFLGVIQRSTYHIIFLCGAVLVSVNIFVAILVFKEVPRSGEVKTVGDAVSNIKIAMKDKKFVVMVFLIGGFWALYSTFLGAMPTILFGFRRLPGWFDVMLLGVFNPFTIIALGIPLAKYIEKIESMRVVLTGIMVYLIGLAIIGFTLQWTFVIVGIVIASVGEFIVAPGYMAFVSKLATKEKVSAYVGCNFISYMVGLLGGTFFFGMIVTFVGIENEMPHFFYGILMAFGLGLLVVFVIYYWTWGQDIIERAKRIKALEEGEEKEPTIPSDYKEPALFRIFDSKISVIVCLILIPIVLVSTYGMGTMTFYPPEEEEDEATGFNPDDYIISDGPMFEASGSAQEQSPTTETFIISSGEGEDLEEDELLRSITFILTWTDEPSDTGFENDPDEFSLEVETPNGTSFLEGPVSDNGGTGMVTISIDFDPEKDSMEDSIGSYAATIICVSAGDQHSMGPFGIFTTPDTGNDYDLMVTSEVYTPK